MNSELNKLGMNLDESDENAVGINGCQTSLLLALTWFSLDGYVLWFPGYQGMNTPSQTLI